MVLRIPTAMRVGRGANGAPNGTLRDVRETPADFLEPKTVRHAMTIHPDGYFSTLPAFYDEYYVFESANMKLEAELVSPSAGRKMQIYANGQGMVFYNPANRAPEPGKNGAIYQGYPALCLQPGFVPNAVNCSSFLSPIVHKGETFRQHIHYVFSTF
jgi:aldose 1-epimerase